MRLLIVFALIATCCCGFARPPFLQALKSRYKFPDGSPASVSGCKICHTQPPKRNEFGSMVDEALGGDATLNNQVLAKIDNLKAPNGKGTIQELLTKGELPAGEATPAPTTELTPPAEVPPLVPNHSFHPAVVHFPIGLLLFSAFLALLNLMRPSTELESASRINLLGAVASLAIVLPTGIAAWLRLGYKLEGAMLIHLLLGTTSSLLMIAAALALKKNPRVSLFILGIAALVVGATGHWGSLMVYN